MAQRLRQAELERTDNVHTITWIPTEFAVVGKLLVDSKSRPWKVVRVYRHEIESDEMNHGWKVGGLK